MLKIEGKTFAVTGGASQVGRDTAAQLLAAGAAKVRLVDNFALSKPEDVEEFAGSDVETVLGDITDPAQLRDAFEGMYGVFHLAAFLSAPLETQPGLGLNVNVMGTVNVLDAAVEAGASRLVFASATGVYGHKSTWQGMIPETYVYDHLKYPPSVWMYTSSKMIGEGLCKQYNDQGKIETISLRYSTVYGPRQHTRGMNSKYLRAAVAQVQAGETVTVPPEGVQFHDYVFVGDVGRANLMGMESDVSGASFTIASGQTRSVRDLVAATAAALGAEMVDPGNYTPDPNVGPFTLDVSAAKEAFGWEPKVMLEEGVIECLKYEGTL